MRVVSCRSALREAFISDLQDELAHIGFTLIWLPSGGYGLIKTASFESWPLISMRDRLSAEMKALKNDDRGKFDSLIQTAYEAFAEVDTSDDDEPDDE